MQTMIPIAGGVLRRIGYLDVAIPADAVGLTEAEVSASRQLEPCWSDADKPQFGAAIWVARLGDTLLAFDPVQATDDFFRSDTESEQAQQQAVAGILAAADCARERVDVLVMSHIEGVGMVAWRDRDGSWRPFFPNARILISARQLEDFRSTPASNELALQQQAWSALLAQGCVDTFEDGEQLCPGLRARVTDGHCPGHAVFEFDAPGGGPGPLFLGHLAVLPLHLASGECPSLNADPVAAHAAMVRERERGRTLVGPLWPAPGCGRWDGTVLRPVPEDAG